MFQIWQNKVVGQALPDNNFKFGKIKSGGQILGKLL